MKKMVCHCLVGVGLLCSFNAHAIEVQLLFTNNTDLDLEPRATFMYELKGETIWDEPIVPPTRFVSAHAVGVAVDRVRSDYDSYFLNYFDLFDRNNKFIYPCLYSYLPILKNATIHFSLNQIGKADPTYECEHNITYH